MAYDVLDIKDDSYTRSFQSNNKTVKETTKLSDDDPLYNLARNSDFIKAKEIILKQKNKFV